LVSGYSIATDGDRPIEQINLNFTKMELKYVPYDSNHKPQSPIVASYDLASTKSG
jgi:type VI secretion system secreted protein Hcp